MKVDKAVCTNGTLEDLVEAIKYKALFSTLIQNKILANKKEYEESILTKKKRRKSVGRYFFGKKWICRESRRRDPEVKRCNNSLKRIFFRRKLEREAERNKSEDTADTDDLALSEFGTAVRVPKKCDLNLAQNQFDNNVSLSSLPRPLHANADANAINADTDANDNLRDADASEPISYEINNSSCFINNAPAADDINGSVESMPYLINSRNQQTKLHILEAKSISAQCSPILLRHSSSAQPSQTLSMSMAIPHPYQVQNKTMVVTDSKSCNNTKNTLLRSTCTLYDEKERAVLARCEPSSAFKSSSLVAISNQNQNQEDQHNQQRLYSISNNKSKIVSNLAMSNYIPSLQMAISRSSTPGTIARLAPESSAVAVAADSQVVYIEERGQIYRKSSTSSESSVTLAKFYSQKTSMPPSWRSSFSEDEYIKHQRYKRYHQRNSDPVIVCPPAGELQQCVLSMPRSAIHMNYMQQDAICDMTLEVDSRKNELKTLVEKKHKKHHKRHRHKKHRRYKKSKLLVRKVEAEHLKVVDPDDLSQRARWTIIATACLLLLMCLMLVGITLRMAPIIDEMVRQENERLMQQSMNFGRIARNFTGAEEFYAKHFEIA